MQIDRVRAHIVQLPADEPLADGKVTRGATRDLVTVKIRSTDGSDGIGVTFFGAAMTGALRRAVEELGALVVGEDPHGVERIVEKLRQAAGSSGPGGIFTLALSAIDTALWEPARQGAGAAGRQALGRLS